MMNWAALVTVALSLWGTIFPGRITVIDPSANPAYANVTVHAGADLWSVAPDCIIFVFPRNMAYLTDSERQRVITHEVGHCLGLMHDSQHAGIMYPDGSQYDLNEWDRAALWALPSHPAPYRVTLGMVSLDE